MKFTPLGGGQEIGANCFLYEIEDKIIMIDAGRHPSKEGFESLPEISGVGYVDYIIITHSHYDHVSALPWVAKKFPDAQIIVAKENRNLMIKILHNSVSIMKRENEENEAPIFYQHADVTSLKKMIIPLEFNAGFQLSEKISITLLPAGHVMGSASVLFEVGDKRIFHTGDFSLTRQLSMSSAELPEYADIVISEGTYGSDEKIVSRQQEEKRLLKSIKTTIKNGGKVLLPVFTLGRAQEVMYFILKEFDDKKLEKVPVYINGMVTGLANHYIANYEGKSAKERNWFQRKMRKYIKVIPDDYSKLLKSKGSSIFILSSGMLLEDTLSYKFAKKLMRSSKNSIHFVGYLCNDTPGKKLLTSAKSGNKFIDETGKEHNIKCRVEQFNFSAHANYRDLINLPRILQPKKLIYIHGDKESLENLAEELQYEFEIKIPKNFEEIIL